MTELANFFHMGGYAWYVWPSMAITFVVLLANVWFSKRQFKSVLRETATRSKALAQKHAQRRSNKTTEQSS